MKNIELMLIILGFGCNTIIAQKIEKMDTAEAYIFSYFIYSGNAEDFSNNELYVLLLKNKNYIEEILSCNTKDYQYCEKSDILIKKIQKIIRKEAIGTLFFVPGLPYLSLMEYIGKYNDTEFITSFAQRKSVQELLIPGNQDDILNGNIVSGFTGYYPTLQTDTETSSKEIKIVQPKRSYIFKKEGIYYKLFKVRLIYLLVYDPLYKSLKEGYRSYYMYANRGEFKYFIYYSDLDSKSLRVGIGDKIHFKNQDYIIIPDSVEQINCVNPVP